MGILTKPYELSVWGDVSSNGAIQEEKLFVIGSDKLTSQSRALQPKLVNNINGTNTLTFSIYYRYKDNVTGEKVDNPFAEYLTNERKLKLKYDDKWYDFIIKSVKVDSGKWSYEVTATDQYINELSKNGFDITFDAELNNNVGSVQGLTQTTLANTNWVVPSVGSQSSEFIPDIAKEALVVLQTNTTISAYLINDTTIGVRPTETTASIPSGSRIYGFYSCCKDQTNRFSFYYFPNESIIEKDDERVITTRQHQYYIDNVVYNTNDTAGYGIGKPNFTSVISGVSLISSQYRGARYVFSPDSQYNSIIKKYVTKYQKNNQYYYGYTETTYQAPNLIENWVTNPNSFKSTSGWDARTSQTGSECGEVRNLAVRYDGGVLKTLIEDLQNGDFSESNIYTSILRYTKPNNNNGILVNTGFYDNRVKIKNLENGTKYTIKLKTLSTFPTAGRILLGQYSYDVVHQCYDLTGTTFFSVNLSQFVPKTFGTDTAYYATVTIQNADFTPAQYKVQADGKVILVFAGINNIDIVDFQVFEYIQDGNDFIIPEEQVTEAKVITTYYMYSTAIDLDPTKTLDDYKPAYKGTDDPLHIASPYTQVVSCEKRRAITIKQSNFFNIIQTICENFECWAKFHIIHDAQGNVTNKYITFHNYIGDDNYAGFRYGVNLKSIQRTDDSKQIVTKLIVKQNSNEFGEHGFCTIARAGSNETGETCIYNFDYYINQGLLNANTWSTTVYNTAGQQGKDVNPSDINTNCNGYYPRLNNLNKLISEVNESLLNKAIVLAKAQSDLSVYENGYLAAQGLFEEANENIKKFCGYYYDELSNADQGMLEKNIKYVIDCAENLQAMHDYTVKKTSQKAYVATLNTDYKDVEDNLNTLLGYKDSLNKAFYTKFYRFIQEGTWNSEDYYDDEKYYLDAVSTLYTSAVPKVSYTISALELSQLQGYQDFSFALGDKTFIEDPEFFGYDEDGNPIREDVTLTEITYNLDSPEKNTVKISNYKTSFQDLFKKITATVQSVQYSTGAYDKAAQ